MLTANEKKVIKYLLVNFNLDKSINEVAKDCHLSPNGALKILRKLEKESILHQKKIANIKAYKISCSSSKARHTLELAFMDKIEWRLEHRYQDLLPLQQVVEICIAFGSYITEKKKPDDLDLITVINKTEFRDYKQRLAKIQEITPVKIHDVLQTKKDFIDNMHLDNKVIKKALQEGTVLWGHERLIEVLFHVCQ